MNIKRIGIFLIIVLFLFGCKQTPETPTEVETTPETGTSHGSGTSSGNGTSPGTGTSHGTGSSPGTVTPIDPNAILLTVGSKKDLTSMLNAEMSGKTITWSSSDSTKVSVDNNGVITSNLTSFTTAEGGSQKFTQGSAKAQATITAKAADDATQTFNIAATTEPQESIANLSPFKDLFPASILVGNIAASNDGNGSKITNASLIRHFNALTPENDMKPDAVTNGRNASTGVINYTWTKADNFVNAATGSNFKIIGHTLLWHSQIPQWQKDMAKETKDIALSAMKQFITDVMSRYKGKIYSWDILNEVFPDGVSASADWKTAMRAENPWFKAIGYEFVYEAYLAARQADPNAKLFYNDYNTDQSGKATMIRDMVRDVNQQYKAAFPSETRLLIEGIAMQEHHNTSVSAASIRATLNMFKALGVKAAVSEIDVLGQGWSEFSSVGQGANKHNQSTVTNNGLLTQADLYRQYMAVYMDFKDIIERISIWGITDNNSWRSAGLPLLFDHNGKAKPAYYKFAGAVIK